MIICIWHSTVKTRDNYTRSFSVTAIGVHLKECRENAVSAVMNGDDPNEDVITEFIKTREPSFVGSVSTAYGIITVTNPQKLA